MLPSFYEFWARGIALVLPMVVYLLLSGSPQSKCEIKGLDIVGLTFYL